MTNTISPVRHEDEKAVREIVQRVIMAWKDNDADAFAAAYSADASVVLPGAGLKGRPAVRDYMAAAFDGKWKGTQVHGTPLELRYLADDVVLLVSRGGAYPPSATEIPVEHAVRAMWVFVKQNGEWTLAAYGNTPTHAPVPLSDAG